MISSISNAAQAYAAQTNSALQISNAAVASKLAPAAQKQSEPAQDTVHFSAAALAASKDADHDGDGHL